MELTLLGTGNPLPDPHRAGAATLVRAGGLTLLVDAGRGVTMRLAAAGAFPPQLSAVLLTHLHSDHICDLNDVFTTRWVMALADPGPLPIVGPPGTAGVVAGMQAMLEPDVRYRLAHHPDLHQPPTADVQEATAGVVLEHDGVRVVAAGTDHRPVEPTLGYRIEHGGAAIVLGGDSVPCAGLDELCAGADVYVQTVLREDLIRAIGVPRLLDTIDYHSSVAQAAQTAARAGIRTLVLTHQVPTPASGSDEEWRALAAEHFDGDIVVGHDLTVVAVR
jgi:ribonuclease Z